MRAVAFALFLLFGSLTIRGAGEPGIIKGADEFEFLYRVKLPEITGAARIWIPLAKTNRDAGTSEHPNEMGEGSRSGVWQ